MDYLLKSKEFRIFIYKNVNGVLLIYFLFVLILAV